MHSHFGNNDRVPLCRKTFRVIPALLVVLVIATIVYLTFVGSPNYPMPNVLLKMYNEIIVKGDRRPARVLCWITTHDKGKNYMAIQSNSTFATKCDKTLVMTENAPPGSPPEVIGVHSTPGYSHLTEKTYKSLEYISMNYLEDYDWFLKIDDDTYVVVENLRVLLEEFDPEDALWGGFYLDREGYDYFSGGGGYIISRACLRQMKDKFKDREAKEGTAEDQQISLVVQDADCKMLDTRDGVGSPRFIAYSSTAVGHVKSRFKQRYWVLHRSAAAVTFHYTKPHLMYFFHYLLYHANVYGKKPKSKIIHRTPAGAYDEAKLNPELHEELRKEFSRLGLGVDLYRHQHNHFRGTWSITGDVHPIKLISTNAPNGEMLPQVLCAITTGVPDDVENLFSGNSWGLRCNKVVLLEEETVGNTTTLRAVQYNVEGTDVDNLKNGTTVTCGKLESDKEQMQTKAAKMSEIVKCIAKNFIDDASWFLTANSDTYVIVENLKLMLWEMSKVHKASSKGVCIGLKGNNEYEIPTTGKRTNGSFVMNRQALMTILTNDVSGGSGEGNSFEEEVKLMGIDVLDGVDSHNRQRMNINPHPALKLNMLFDVNLAESSSRYHLEEDRAARAKDYIGSLTDSPVSMLIDNPLEFFVYEYFMYVATVVSRDYSTK